MGLVTLPQELSAQTKMPLVILTYPGHFLLTALTIQTYLKFHTPPSITVIVDDLSKFAWPEYIIDCQQQYPYAIITTSSIASAQEFPDSPWVRQQIIKLHLDQVLPYDKWFFTDGDVEYRFPASHNAVPYVTTQGGPVQRDQNNYVSLLLGVENPGIYTDHCSKNWNHDTKSFSETWSTQQVCVSNPPFRTMTAQALQDLRTHVVQCHNKDLITIHKELITIPELNCQISISEWELLANFQQHVLKQDINLVYYPTVPLGETIKYTTPTQPNYCGTCYASDSAYSREWWRKQGIEVADTIWNEISKISK